MKNYSTILPYAAFGCGFIMLVMSIMCNIKVLCCNTSSMIISFIGILATFIVIGNYAQVKEIEMKFEQKLSLLKEEREMLMANDFADNVRSIIFYDFYKQHRLNTLMTIACDMISKLPRVYGNDGRKKDRWNEGVNLTIENIYMKILEMDDKEVSSKRKISKETLKTAYNEFMLLPCEFQKLTCVSNLIQELQKRLKPKIRNYHSIHD